MWTSLIVFRILHCTQGVVITTLEKKTFLHTFTIIWEAWHKKSCVQYATVHDVQSHIVILTEIP